MLYGQFQGAGRRRRIRSYTRYIDAALRHLRATGLDVSEQDVARLSPLGNDHINLIGRYHFGLPDAVKRGAMRPFRNPADLDL